MQIVSLFIFNFSFLTVLDMFELVHGDEGALHKSLVDFLELQMDYCGAFPLCTLKLENNRSLQAASATCCKSCSCDTACVEMGTCCPDFTLASLNDDILTANLSNTHHLVKYSKLFESQLEEREKKNNQNLNCVDAKINKQDFRFLDVLSSYWMIDSCLNDTPVDMKVAIKCKSDMYESNEFDPDLFVPVTSLKTNTTYKNVYCYRCNEHGDGSWDIIPWTVNYICFYYYVQGFFEDPYTQMKKTASNTGYSACNILYKPRKHIQHLVSRCELLGINSCSDTSDVQLNEICEFYHSPFLGVKTGITFQRYKNIACYLCNEPKLVTRDCSPLYPDTKPFTLEMNLLFDRQGSVMGNEVQRQILNVSVGKDSNGSSSCKTGYIMSADMVTCKPVLCPRHYYPLNGSCIPAFTLTENICYTIVMEVLRVQKIDHASKIMFHKIYSDTVAQLAAGLFERFTFGLWEMSEHYDALILTFTMPNETTYSEAITSLVRFLTKIAFLKIKTRLGAVDVVTLISKDSTLVFFGGNLYKKGKTNTPLPSWSAYQSLGKAFKEVRISTSNLCYRAEFGPTEIYRDRSTRTFYVINTEERLFIIDVQDNDESVVVCLEDIYRNLTDMDASYMLGISRERVMAEYIQLKARQLPYPKITNTNTNTKSFLDNLADSAREMIITVVMVLVVAIIFIVNILKKKAARNAREASTVDTA